MGAVTSGGPDAVLHFQRKGFVVFPLSDLLRQDVEVVWRLLDRSDPVDERKCRELTAKASVNLNRIEAAVLNFSKEVGLEKLVLAKVRAQRSAGPPQANLNRAPFALHVDRRRFLKLLVYMSDVDTDDGPITFDTESNYPRTRSFGEVFSSNKCGKNVLGPPVRPHPILGEKGTAVLFDTNAPHLAGLRRADRVREIIRFDFCSSSRTRRLFRTL